MSGPILAGYTVDQFVRRLLVDCMIEQTKQYWLDRALTFENARSRVGDYTGLATAEQIKAQDERLWQIAEACRNAASLCEYGEYREAVEDQFAAVLAETA